MKLNQRLDVNQHETNAPLKGGNTKPRRSNMSNEVTIIIQAKPNLSEAIAKNWDMFLEEVAGNLQTELAWKEICSGIDDIYGNNVKLRIREENREYLEEIKDKL